MANPLLYKNPCVMYLLSFLCSKWQVWHGEMASTKKEDAFVNSGFDNWKKARERFLQHSRSQLHKESLMKVEMMKQESIAALLNKETFLFTYKNAKLNSSQEISITV